MKYTFIESDDQLQSICNDLFDQKVIGVDLEADSMHCFKEKICLLQIATDQEAYLIDPFVVKNMIPFVHVLENKDVIKIFHGSDFDVRSLDRDYNARIHNLFDTEIACRFLGVKERGLGALLKVHFNVTADKKFQKVDWSQRPLKQDMIEYSVEDVAHLTKLYAILSHKLEERGRFDWAKEEFEIQEQVRYEHNCDLPLFLKFKGAGRLDNRSLAVLENLLQLRIKIAQKKDRPLFKVISNEALLIMAFEKPTHLNQMVKMRALSPRQAEMYGEQCKDAIVAAIHLAHKDLPSYPRTHRPKKDTDVLKRVERLKEMRESLSASMGMESGILLNNSAITAIAVENPNTPESLINIDSIRRWQVEALGETIMTTLGHRQR
ncbi:MAG: HRDC domain-containing protein [Pseudomonadota bacterium]